MIKVKLSNSRKKFTLDDEDKYLVDEGHTFYLKNGFVTYSINNKYPHETIYVHRKITGISKYKSLKFKNNNKLDCRRENLISRFEFNKQVQSQIVLQKAKDRKENLSKKIQYRLEKLAMYKVSSWNVVPIFSRYALYFNVNSKGYYIGMFDSMKEIELMMKGLN